MREDNDNSAPANAGALSVLDLFSAAAGGWSLGMHRAGFHTIAACEVISWRRALYSQNNPGVPVYDDVTTLTADRLIRDGVGLPRVIVGSPPCQDISSANTKGKGVDGERSGLYFEAIRLIDECQPDWFALENSANLRTRGADRVIDALEAIGYTCWPFVVSAGDIGANHERKRSWLVGFSLAYADGVGRNDGRQGWWSGFDVSNAYGADGPRGDVADTAQVGRCTRAGDNEGDVREIDGRIAGNSNDNGSAANAAGLGHEGGRSRRHGENGDRAASVGPGHVCEHGIRWPWSCDECDNAAYLRDTTDPNEEGQAAGLQESSPRSTSQSGAGCSSEWRDDGEGVGQVGGGESTGDTPPEPWADWNGGLAHHLRLDDGLSAWVAQSRIEVGGPRGTVAASLIVEAFGDAVCPQIPEAIGRAILRVEAALAVIHGAPIAANDNNKQDIASAAA